jgi:uncharacterized repeat protein (TIGR04138 family)
MAQSLATILKSLLQKDKRYKLEAYGFLFEALSFTIEHIGQKRHVNGQELLQGIRKYAIKQFGQLSKMVLNSWGVYKTDDFGEMVFGLVEAGFMGKTDDDTLEDFKDGYDFDTAFNLDVTESKTC